jgi:hypothetical protein
VNTLTGSCHCGNISVSFITTRAPESFDPRACDCDFCLKHSAMYVSDPDGSLLIEAESGDRVGRYRQGSKTADFVFCRGCGILVAVTFERDGSTLGAVNARCLRDFERFGAPVSVSPQKLARDEKTARWETIWTKDVRIAVGRPLD